MRLSLNFSVRFSMTVLRKSMENCKWHIITVTILEVTNNCIYLCQTLTPMNNEQAFSLLMQTLLFKSVWFNKQIKYQTQTASAMCERLHISKKL